MIRQSPSGALLPQYQVQFQPVNLSAFNNVIETITAVGVVPGQNVVANFAPLPAAGLSTQAWVVNPDQVKVQIYNATASGMNLTQVTNVTITPM